MAVPMTADTPAAAPNDNPLLTDWSAPFGMPPFNRIRPEHFLPAFRAAIRMHDAEIAAIAASEAAPTFASTVVALDDAGEMLTRVNNVFGVVSNAETSEALQAVEEQVKTLLAAHADDIWLNEALFGRVKAV
jgi:peptidyl-dipeptidase Dcp